MRPVNPRSPSNILTPKNLCGNSRSRKSPRLSMKDEEDDWHHIWLTNTKCDTMENELLN